MDRLNKILLGFIIILALFLRLYQLDQIPTALNWDEVDAGYNAYTIANWGKDEWGQFLPLVFTSFKDDKHPVHIYLTVPFIKLFGLSDFTTRLPGALVGTLSVIVIYFLSKIIFKNNWVSILSALSLAVSPYHLQFSRGLWEVNFALFFFMTGLLLFHLALQKKGWLISFSFLCFGISALSYHSAKIVVPSMLFLLISLYFKDLRKLSRNFYLGIFVLLIFIALIILNPRLLGTARAKQTQFSPEFVEKTRAFQLTKSNLLGLGEIVLNQYVSHFTPEYLFFSGDQSPRNSVKKFGEFYKIEAVFILIGLFYLLKSRSKITPVLLSWILLAPISASVVNGAPSATRAIFMLGGLNILSAFGAVKTIGVFKGNARRLVSVGILVFFSIQFYLFLNYYFFIYPKKDAVDWQYGMKQIVEFVNDHPEYSQVYVTDIRSQPYIFFLFYLKTPLPEFLNTVIYNRSEESRRYNTVYNFDKYYFGGWNPIESMPIPGVLYVLCTNQYDGLKDKNKFEIKKVIRYPDGGDAFLLVSGI